MKHLLIINTFFMVLAILNGVRLNLSASKVYRRRVKKGYIEAFISYIMVIMFCAIPLLNIGIAFLSEEVYLKSLIKDETFEKIQE